MKHAPQSYSCPFCEIESHLLEQRDSDAVVFENSSVFALIPLHYYSAIHGNVIIVPRQHHENIFDLPVSFGADIFSATRILGRAMLRAFKCQGISSRQHNGPAGDQDIWHYHLHLFPRFYADGLYGGLKSQYSLERRKELASQLRHALIQDAEQDAASNR